MQDQPPALKPEIKPLLPKLEKAPAYTIVSSADMRELDLKVSKLLEGGSYRLHGGPFVFHDQICQAMAMYQYLRHENH